MLLFGIVMLFVCTTNAQHTIILSIKDSEKKTPLAGATATITALNKSIVADSFGTAKFINIAAGQYQINISYIGFEEMVITVQVPQIDDKATEVLLTESDAHEEHDEEVVVTATRISRTIANIPTRVEVIS